MKTKNKITIMKKCIAMILSLTLVFTMAPMIPGVADKAYAASGSAITLFDSTGNQIVIDTTEGGDATNHTGTGYSYDECRGNHDSTELCRINR